MIVHNGNIVVNNGRWIIPHHNRKHDPILGDIVEIGDQWWMSENLAIDDGEGGISKALINGKLEYRYTREAAMRISSRIDGWHLPTKTEWGELFNYVSNGSYSQSGADNHIYDLRSTSGWYNNQNGTNLTGFNAYPTYESLHEGQTTTKEALYLIFDPSRDGNHNYGNSWARITYVNRAGVEASNYETSLSVRLIKDRAILPYPKYDINPLKLPRYTFRVRFQQGYTPTNSLPKIWSYNQVSAADNIWDLKYIYSKYAYKLNSGGNYMINDTDRPYVVELLGANTQGVMEMGGIFNECTNMVSITNRFDCSSLQSCTNTFSGCESLTEVPLLNFFTGRSSVSFLFDRCYNVEHGTVDLYNQLLKQNWINHAGTFQRCGNNTVTGAAELAQIPGDWK